MVNIFFFLVYFYLHYFDHNEIAHTHPKNVLIQTRVAFLKLNKNCSVDNKFSLLSNSSYKFDCVEGQIGIKGPLFQIKRACEVKFEWTKVNFPFFDWLNS